MRKSLLIASAMLFVAGSGLAVAQPAPPPGGPGAGMNAGPPPPPRGPDGAGPDRGPAGARGPLADRMMPPPPPGGPGGRGPRGRGAPPPPGAHIHVQHGTSIVDVQCQPDQSMDACADIAQRLLLDRVADKRAR